MEPYAAIKGTSDTHYNTMDLKDIVGRKKPEATRYVSYNSVSVKCPAMANPLKTKTR